MAGGLLALSALMAGCAVVPAYPPEVGISAGVYVNPPPPVVVGPVYAYPAYPAYRHYRHPRRYYR